MGKQILVGYDPRRGDRAPVDFGTTLARVTGAQLIVAAVAAGTVPPVVLSAGQETPYSVGQRDDDLVDDAGSALEELASELRVEGVAVDWRLLVGASAARALHEEAEREDAGLLVVGSSREAGPGRVGRGSTADRLLHGAPCPLAVVPQNWTERALATIGAGYVATDEGREALREAHALARRMGSTLRAITVLKEHEEDQRPEAEEELRRAVEALGGDVPVEVELRVGDPAEGLVRASRELDLLVCGSRGYGPLRAVLLGSVSRRVADAAHCPVIVLPRGVERSLEGLLAETPGARVSGPAGAARAATADPGGRAFRG